MEEDTDHHSSSGLKMGMENLKGCVIFGRGAVSCDSNQKLGLGRQVGWQNAYLAWMSAGLSKTTDVLTPQQPAQHLLGLSKLAGRARDSPSVCDLFLVSCKPSVWFVQQQGPIILVMATSQEQWQQLCCFGTSLNNNLKRGIPCLAIRFSLNNMSSGSNIAHLCSLP